MGFSGEIAGRHALRQGDKREPIDGLDAVPVVVAVPREVAANVRQTVQRDRAHRLEIAHPGQTVFGRHRDQLFNFFGAETVGQRQNLDQRLNRIRIGLDIELRERKDAGQQQHQRDADHDYPLAQRQRHQRSDHRLAKDSRCHRNAAWSRNFPREPRAKAR